MKTDTPTYAPVPIRIAADNGIALTLTRAHLEEIREDYPESAFINDVPFGWDPHSHSRRSIVRAVFVLLPDEDGHIALLRKPDSKDDPIYRSLFRRYQQ